MKVPFRTRQAYLSHLAFYYTRVAEDAAVQSTVADVSEATLDRVVPEASHDG